MLLKTLRVGEPAANGLCPHRKPASGVSFAHLFDAVADISYMLGVGE